MTEPLDPTNIPEVLPVLPLRDSVVYPYIIVPLSIARASSLTAIEQCLREQRLLLLVAQRDASVDRPQRLEELCPLGTAAQVLRMLKLPDGRVRVLAQGISRARLAHLSQTEPMLCGRIELVPELPVQTTPETEAALRLGRDQLRQLAALGREVSDEVQVLVSNLEDPGRLADLLASNLELPIQEAQEVLELQDPLQRLARVNELLRRDLEILGLQEELSVRARGEVEKQQREYYLRQQLRAIHEQLGDATDVSEEAETYRRQARERGVSEEGIEEVERQLRRLQSGPPESAEGAVVRSYLDCLVGLPWSDQADEHYDLKRAREVLETDHYGLHRIKERILEMIAVRALNPEARGPLLCFVGPPGVGKTSLGRSIARALNRPFVRLSLGGVVDEAEIRGHRRTYVGALPGRILQGLQQAGVANPVFMLDEVDKLGRQFRGDPSAALLEVLDPEQNHAFRDHYLGIAYDLSQVLFLTTANLEDPIHPALRDRLEVLRLPGYTAPEKLQIARRHLLARQARENGLGEGIRFTDGALQRIVGDYTKEAGVRELDRSIAALCRRWALHKMEGRELPAKIDVRTVAAWLGPPKHYSEELLDRDRIGVATGLAWTEAGGDILLIEAVLVPGQGKLVLTGRLGEVMKESARAALSFVRGWAQLEGIERSLLEENDIHIHVPAGSVPKDGPSAGITIAAALASLVSGRPLDRRLALTGELTLRGEILPVGGLREKILAAHAAGIGAVLLPGRNRRDYQEIPEALRAGIEVAFVTEMDEVLHRALRTSSAPAPV